MAVDTNKEKGKIIQIAFVLATVIILGQLLNLQVLNTDFKAKAEAAGASNQLLYPARGILFDRNGELLVVNKPIYDLSYIYNQFEKEAEHFDTLKFCKLLDVPLDYFKAALDKDWRDIRYSKAKPQLFLSRIGAERFATLQESLYEFPGFVVKERNARSYPHSNAAHVLGYIGEVNSKVLLNDTLNRYMSGDYLGVTGIEKQYESYLRGEKGVRKIKKDIYGRITGSLYGGERDISP